MKKRIISGLTAVGMLLLQVPVLVTTTLADTLSMEQAYYHVLDNIVRQHGLSVKTENNFSWTSGLTYAQMLDFDQNGTTELLVMYQVEDEYNKRVEIWEYKESEAKKEVEFLYDGWFGKLFLQTLSDGKVQIHSDDGYGDAGYTGNYDTFYKYNQGNLEKTSFSENINSIELGVSDAVEETYFIGEIEVSKEEFNVKFSEFSQYQHSKFIAMGYETYDDDYHPDYDLYYELQYSLLDLEEIKEKLPYTGDLSTMFMTAEQALAMADKIQSLGNSVASWVGLFDDGTGRPAMWLLHIPATESNINFYSDTDTSYINEDKWIYRFHEDQVYLWDTKNKNLNELYPPDIGFKETFRWINIEENGTFMVAGSIFNSDGTGFYPIYDLKLSEQGEHTSYVFLIDYPISETDTIERVKEEITSELNTYGLFEGDIDWDKIEIETNNESTSLKGLIVDGAILPIDQYEAAEKFVEIGSDDLFTSFVTSDARGNWADGNETAALLRAYAEKVQFRFDFPEISQNNATLDPILSELNLSGEVQEFYQLGENFFYLIFLENGVETGCIVKLVKINGKLSYIMVDKATTFLEEHTLLSALTDYTVNSNILLNFEEIINFSQEKEYLDYLMAALDNVTGARLTDNGKSELVTFLQDSITNYATYVLQSSGETAEIGSHFVSDLLLKSNNLYGSYTAVLADKSEELNKNLQQSVRVVVRDLNPENWTMYLNGDLLDQLGENNLQVFLEDGHHGLEFSGEDLNLLLSAYDGVFVNVQQSAEGQYIITFADKEGNNIEKLEAPVKIFLPTENEFATVMLEYAQGTENWGGQYNASTNTIQFSTIHSGTYLIVDNSVEIHDVDEAYKTMIQFMVSKGFFTVDESGNFNPNGTMSRYDFTKTIVSMFFALDRELQTTFSDVLAESPYYSYIASGESRGIVAGYDDGLFYGDTIITEEMVFTLIAQTLVDKKGYHYPDDLETYLNLINNSQTGNDWAKKGIALSVRDGIVLPDETIHPTGEISRQNAAVYLYRLFMLLEEKQQVNFQLSDEIPLEEGENSKSSSSTIGFAAMGAGVLLMGGGGLWHFFDQKKQTKGAREIKK